MDKKQNRPLRNTYIFEVEASDVTRGTVPCVEIVDRMYFVDRIGVERLLISSYPYGSNATIDDELDVSREARDELLAAAHECGTHVTRVGLHRIVLEDVRVRDSLIASYLQGLEGLRHFRVKVMNGS